MGTRPEAKKAATPTIPAGKLLAGARISRRWTRPQLARALGWRTERLAAVEEGRRKLSLDELAAAARALDLDSWTLELIESYFRQGGQLPEGKDPDLRWDAFVFGLEVARVLHRFLTAYPRVERAPQSRRVAS